MGGGGFIGHNLAIRLKQKRQDVRVFDPLLVNNYYALWPGRRDPVYARQLRMIQDRLDLFNMLDIPLFHVDARDYHTLSPVLAAFEPEVIIHLAAVSHIDRSNKDPYSTFDHSLRTLENSLDIARNAGKPHFIYFSSSTVYGPFESPVVTEDTTCAPVGIYGNLKLAGERMVIAYGQTYGLPYTIVRPCALYGPRCVSGRVTQKFLEAAYDGKAIRIDGDGSGIHDFTYIDDLIGGIFCMLGKPEAVGETFNITAGQARSLADLAMIVIKHRFTDLTYGPEDPEKPSRGTLSIEKAQRLIGYTPRYTLEQGMGAYMHWYEGFLEDGEARQAQPDEQDRSGVSRGQAQSPKSGPIDAA